MGNGIDFDLIASNFNQPLNRWTLWRPTEFIHSRANFRCLFALINRPTHAKKVITSCDCDGLQKWLYFIIRRFISAAALFSIRFVCLFLLYLRGEPEANGFSFIQSIPFYLLYSSLALQWWKMKEELRLLPLLPPLSLASRMDENENERMRWEIWRWKKMVSSTKHSFHNFHKYIRTNNG